MWRGRALDPFAEIEMFFQDRGPVPETFARLRRLLDAAGIEFVVIGAFALGAHKYRRATEDVDVCLPAEGFEKFKRELVGASYERVEGRSRRFRDSETRVTIYVLNAGDLAGRTSRNKEIRFPSPAEAMEIGGIPTVSLARLVELKLVTWRMRDWADVIALIRENELDEEFAEQLNPLVRMAYLECYDEMIEEDRYNPEIHDAPR
ncbi:MAG: hypothetical protein HOP29_09845 [Phycisphaerales bacterium]|nr:hypothetical protein [Phycisphaerales bacterium]